MGASTSDCSWRLAEKPALALSAEAAEGPVLIGWHHEAIPALGNAIMGDQTTVPQVWPSDRFDMVWVFDRQPSGSAWRFSQIAQMALSGDQATLIG